MTITDTKIKKLWLSEDFPGHYSGINTLQHCLEIIKNVKVSKERLRKILHEIPNYQMHVQRKNKGPRRPYVVYRYGELVQGDLAVMWDCESFQYFVVIVDVYTMNIFTRPLKTKLASEMKTALEDIFVNDLKLYPEKFETDQGGEFEAKLMRKYYTNKNIFYKVKRGVNKASVAENAIKTVKRKLFMLLRQSLSRDWVKYLPIINEALNLQPRPALGYMSPVQVQCPEAGPVLERAKAVHHVVEKKEPTIKVMKKNQSNFEESASESPYKVGNYVYKNFLPQAFDKSFDAQVSIKTPRTLFFSFLFVKIDLNFFILCVYVQRKQRRMHISA